jgi:hypothetical protein
VGIEPTVAFAAGLQNQSFTIQGIEAFNMVGSDGLEPSVSEEGRFTVSCNSRYATRPKLAEIEGFEPSGLFRTRDFSKVLP